MTSTIGQLNTQTHIIHQVKGSGGDPRSWLEVIEREVCADGKENHDEKTYQLYELACENLDPFQYRNDENFAKLLIRKAKYEELRFPKEAENTYKFARDHLTTFAAVHIAFAQFQLHQGNKEKCKKILQRAKDRVLDKTLLLAAYSNFIDGKKVLLKDSETVEKNDKLQKTIPTASSGDLSKQATATNIEMDGSDGNPSDSSGNSKTGSVFLSNSQRLFSSNQVNVPINNSAVKLNNPSKVRLTSTALFGTPVASNRRGQDTATLGEANLSSTKLFANTPSETRGTVRDLPKLSAVLGFKRPSVDNSCNIDDMNNADALENMPLHSSSQILSNDKITSQNNNNNNHAVHQMKKLLKINNNNDLEDIKEHAYEEQAPDLNNDINVRSLTKSVSAPNVNARRLLNDKCGNPPALDPKITKQSNSGGSARMDQHNNFTDHPKASTAAQISKEAGHNTDHRKKSSSHLNRHLTTITVNDKDYMVIKAIGRGGTSKVYSAITPSGKICAIKVVDLTGADELIRTSYFKEITLLENLRGCETIVQLYDWEVQDLRDELIVVMEHGSTDLAVFLKKEDPRKMADWHRISFWKQMLLAVDLIHKKGIIHCDLKPANFIIVEGKLKLIDFNIADAIQEDETSIKREMTVGSFNYMAPEAIVDTRQKGFRYKGKPSAKIGRKADVWSLGCILYYMVYGRTPFQSIMDNVEKLCKIIDPHYNIDFPDVANTVWVDVIKKCLQRDPNERASIEELLNLDLYKVL